AQGQGHVHVAFHGVTIGHQVELAQFAVQRLLGNPLNGTFVDHPVVNQVGDGADLDVVFCSKGFEFGAAGHGAVVVHHFADHAARLETGHACEVAGGFSVAGA